MEVFTTDPVAAVPKLLVLTVSEPVGVLQEQIDDSVVIFLQILEFLLSHRVENPPSPTLNWILGSPSDWHWVESWLFVMLVSKRIMTLENAFIVLMIIVAVQSLRLLRIRLLLSITSRDESRKQLHLAGVHEHAELVWVELSLNHGVLGHASDHALQLARVG